MTDDGPGRPGDSTSAADAPTPQPPPWTPPSTGSALPQPESDLPPGWTPVDTSAETIEPAAPSEIYGYRPPPSYGNPLAAHKPGIIPLRPLGVGDILSGALTAITSNLRVVAAISGIAAAVGVVVILLVSALTEAVDTDNFEDVDTALGAVGGIATFAISAEVAVVALLTGALCYPMSRATLGRYPSLRRCWERLSPRMPSLFAVAGIEFAIIALPLLLVTAIFAAAAAAASAALAVLGMVVAVVAALFLLVIVTFVCFAIPITVLEGLGPMDSLRRSVLLVRPIFWRVFGILLLTGLITAVAQSVFTTPAGMIGSLAETLGGGAAAAVVRVAADTVLSALSQFLIAPYLSGVVTLLYTDARIRLEGFDITLIAAAQQPSKDSA